MQELLSKLSELIKGEFNKELMVEAKAIMDQVRQQLDTERKEALAEFLEDPENKAEDFAPTPSEEATLFESLRAEFNDKRKAYTERRAKEEKENLERKIDIIKKISSITKEEENIGKAFNIFKELQEEWNTIGRVPGDKHKDIQNDFHTAVDSFYYDIKIYKDLKENDLNHNLEAKKEIVNKLNVLLKAETDNLEENVKNLQQEWFNIGPVPKEDFEALKEQFDKALEGNYEIIKARRQVRKDAMLENLALKKALLEKTKELCAETPGNVKAWNKTTETLIEYQKAWKSIGFGPRKDNEEVWQEFRAVCDAFFAEKAKFFEDFKKELSLNQTQKEALCDEAEILKLSTDWKETTQKLIQLQKKWKTIGPAPMGVEQKLWKKFRSACDAFFEAKDKSGKELEASFEVNLAAKEEFLAKFEKEAVSEDKAEAVKQIKAGISTWSGLGRVPKKNIAELGEKFQAILDEKMKAAGIEKEELEHSKFTSRVQALLNEEDYKRLLDKEKRFIKDKIDEFKKQAIQYENNLGFFNNTANKKNPLLEEAKKKIAATNNAIDKMLDQLQYIDKSIRQKEKQAKAEVENEENS